MTPLMIERGWPYLATIVVVLIWWFGLGHPIPAKPDALMGASGTVAAVFVGFLGTAKAIVLGLTNSAVYKKLRSAGYANLLYHYLAEALFSAIIFLAVAVVGFFLPENQPQVWFSIVWFVTGVASLLLYVRVTSLLFRLIKQA
ncbi:MULTISPECIES: hypothetical protein [Bradyrhizobium]|uniref:hypothetical protein n=1 Tax=Bradyrhizobium TaxID=374 RepID=UPI00054CF486|nr:MULTISPECIES: hypothetical protein [unclassified Bradyrhizobium]MDA9423979.1 hypothetical protein [Bradyrhizobium sp. CCBAU 53380]